MIYADRDNFIKELFDLSDLKFKAFSEKIVNSKSELIGVKTPQLKSLAKDFTLNDIKAYYQNCKWEYYEETLFAGLILKNFKDERELLSYLKVYFSHADCWAHIDSVVSYVKKIGKNKSFFLPLVQELLSSDKEFEIRAGFVILMCYYLDNEHIDYVFDKIKGDNSEFYYVKMAKAWLLSVADISYSEKTFEYLKTCRDEELVKMTVYKIRDSFRIENERKTFLRNWYKNGYNKEVN